MADAVSSYKVKLPSHTDWIQILLPLLATCVTLGK